MNTDLKPLSDASDFEDFKSLKEENRKATAEPAGEKTTQTEEVAPVSAAEPGTAETTRQEEKTVSIDDQIKDLRAKSKHAAANKLEREAGKEEARRELQAETERLRTELEAFKSRPSEVAAKTEPAKPVEVAPRVDASDPEPKIEDDKYKGSDGYTLYVRDSAVWQFRQENRKELAATQERAHVAKGKAKFEAAVAAHPDASDVIGKVMINQGVIREGVEKLDNFGEVLYKVGSDPALLAKIQSMTPMDQWAELRIVANSLSTPAAAQAAIPEKPKPAPVSKVAAPPRVLSGTSEAPKKSTADAADYEEFKRLKRSNAA